MSNDEMEPIPHDRSAATIALCRSAMFYQWLLAKCVDAHPGLAEAFTADEVRGMQLADDTIEQWRDFLEIRD